MNNSIQIVPEKIHILSINIFKSNIEASEDFLDSPKEIKGFEFGLNHDIAENLEEKLFRIRLHILLEGKDEDLNQVGLTAEHGIEVHLLVDNIDDYIIKENNNEIKLHAVLGNSLLAVAYSTARGIILERTQGTFFKGIILPVIDIDKLRRKEDS